MLIQAFILTRRQGSGIFGRRELET
jgi:hypothetical protein